MMVDKVNYADNGLGGRPFPTNPRLVRSGLASEEFGEMTPVLFKDRLHLLASAFKGSPANPHDDRCLWVEDVATGEVVSTFAKGYGLGSAFVDGDTFYVFAIPNDSGGAQNIDCFRSTDLVSWESHTVLEALPGEELFNESVCMADDQYIMAYESRDANYPPFTIYFAKSNDLVEWERIPGAVYGTDRYTACPTIRYIDDTFYMLYLEHLKPRWWFETFLTRSRDLVHWEQSPRNPVLRPEGIEDINTSDVDMVEYVDESRGPVVRVYYATGNQRTWGMITWAEFEGTQGEFFNWYYPKQPQAR
jgi:hypothetical protein